jgi:hypothetical protein
VFAGTHDLFFLDVDKARADERSPWSPIAVDVLDMFKGAAVEVSVSGRGLHVIGTGASVLPANVAKKIAKHGLELYTTGRYCGFGDAGFTGDALKPCGDALMAFATRYDFVQPAPPAMPAADPTQRDLHVVVNNGRRVDDDEIIRDLSSSMAFTGNIVVRDLWAGDRAALTRHFPAVGTRPDGAGWDWSEADLSLMNHLAYRTGEDREQMVRIFEKWALYRPGQYEGRGSYRMYGNGQGTKGLIPLAIDMVRKRKLAVQPAPPPPTDPFARPPGQVAATSKDARSTMEFAGQMEHFKGCVYIEERHEIMTPNGRLLNAARFNAMYGGWSFQMQHDRGRPTTKAFDAFTENRGVVFPKVRGCRFRPNEAPGSIVNDRVNIWFPPTIEEVEGDIQPFLDHVAKMVPDERDRAILFTYMKSLVRNPGVKFQWAPTIQGTEGNGKSLLIRALAYAVGVEYSHLPKASQIAEKFNDWLEAKLFIGVEEIKITEQKRELLDVLKDYITNDRFEVRGMQQNKRMADNFGNFMFCTNHKDAIPVTVDQRRYAVFFTAQQSVRDLTRDGMTEAYFKGLYDWMKAGGYSAVSYWLRHAPLDPTHDPAGQCVRAPATSSTVDAIKESYGRIEQEIIEAIENDQKGFRKGWMSSAAFRTLLERKGIRELSPRKIGEIIQSLGYEKKGQPKITLTEASEGGLRSTIYRKIDMPTSGDYFYHFLLDQDYQSTLAKIPLKPVFNQN